MHEVESVLFDIVNHIEKYGNHIIEHDQPKQLRFGWWCTETDQVWFLSISQLRNYFRLYPSSPLSNVIKKNLKTKMRITFLPELQKLVKLKAFW